MPVEHADERPIWESVKGLPGSWELYKRLIEPIPADVKVRRVVAGWHWTYVEADCGTGVSMTVRGGAGGCRLREPLRSSSLRDLAALSTSWNFIEASIGVAALNAWHASPDIAQSNAMVLESEDENANGFELYRKLIEGKRVAVVGHFPLIERLSDCCQLSILERTPLAGDLPDPACEYIIAEQDYLFTTGITLQNKTLPRLLQLARESDTPAIMVGPSVVPSPVLFDYGVTCLAGSICPFEHAESVQLAIEQGSDSSIHECGLKKMHIVKPGWEF